jgi:hypothetical protein
MTNVFLSRPTWISKEYTKGLDNFLGFLSGHNLLPRTIGVSDYPNKSPLDKVISVMNECKGVIILGYPQIIVRTGIVKDKKLRSGSQQQLLLATE